MIDAEGTIRDLSGHVSDITGATLDDTTLGPAASIRHRFQLLMPVCASVPVSAESASSCASA